MGKQAASHLATEINAHFTKLGAACENPFNSCSEAIAHINSSKTSKACLYIIHQVILLGLVAFASLKEQYDQPSGELAAHLVKLACEHCGIRFVKPTLREVQRTITSPRHKPSRQQTPRDPSQDPSQAFRSDSARAESIEPSIIDLTPDHSEDESVPPAPMTPSGFRRLYKRMPRHEDPTDEMLKRDTARLVIESKHATMASEIEQLKAVIKFNDKANKQLQMKLEVQDEKWKKIREEIHMKSEKEKACEAEKNKSLQRFLGNTVKQVSKELLSETAAVNRVQHVLQVMGFAAAKDMDFESRSKAIESLYLCLPLARHIYCDEEIVHEKAMQDTLRHMLSAHIKSNFME